MLCRLFGYSKQAYYKHVLRQNKWASDEQLALRMVLSVRQRLPRLGTRKLYYLLKEEFCKQGLQIGRDKLFTLLRHGNLLVPKRKRYTRTTNSKHWMRKYPNRIKGIVVERPEQVWVSDITFIETTDGFNYLHLITDAYSKKIMGYQLSDNMQSHTTLKALDMALANRLYKDELIHHSDRGLQYCSTAYINRLQQNDIGVSMTEQSDPYENAIAERVNGILKDEFGLDENFNNKTLLKDQVNQSIKLYNERRPHLSNHMLTPEQMHLQTSLRPRIWNKKSTETLEGSHAFLPSLPYSKPVNSF